jgi:hypothetical protein
MVLAISGVLVGCGGGQVGGNGSAGAAGSKSAAARGHSSGFVDKAASAEQVAQEARDGVRCPARVASSRPQNAPVDDVLGVRPGMTYDEARNAVLCTNELLVAAPEDDRGFNIKTYGQKVRQGFSARFAEPRVVKSSKQIVQEMQDEAMARGSNRVREDVHPGQAKWYITTMGMPGNERVIGVAREEHFADGATPTAANLEAALTQKYGTPSSVQVSDGDIVAINWAYDPQGHQSPAGAPVFNRCNGGADPDSPVNVNPDCGMAVHVVLQPVPVNHAIVKSMQVSVVSVAGGYALVTATEEGLRLLDQQRQQREIEKASKNAKKPAL